MKRTVLLIILLLFLAAACSADDTENVNDALEDERISDPALEPVLTQEFDELPATAVAEPTETPVPDEYTSLAPTAAPDSYPADEGDAGPPPYPADSSIWVIRPLGTQCTDSSTYEYKTIEEAQMALEDAGINVYLAELTLRGVCESCECATAEHYRARIDESNFDAAQAMGWERE